MYVVKYIEAKSRAPFLFHVRKKSPLRGCGHHMAYTAEADGEWIELDHEHNQEGMRVMKRGTWTDSTNGYYAVSFEDPETCRSISFKFRR